MSDIEFTAADRRSEPIAQDGSAISPRRVLVMRPASFFSNRFKMYVEDEDCEEGSVRASSPRTGINRLADLNLLLLILIIGVPLLIYCIMDSP
ncbi:hypothetical protein ACT009_13140 [Sphingomonas sp. Tas61C01]|uniref:hypothetical protein n=1 Tax=Sphingomonas sp. Tas61C01 TaxID=3458297 RepID=UPI00403EB1D8